MSNVIEPDTKFRPRIGSSLEPQIDWAHGSVILGRDRQVVTELGLKSTMRLGVICEHQTTGASLFGYQVLFDNKFPHIIFICGKRGSGKSYTLGVIVEELGRSGSGIGSVVIDPLGTFWTMKNKNDSKKAEAILARYGLPLKNFKNVRVLTPTGFYEDMKTSVDGAFSVGVSDLSADDWCLVFGIDRFKTQGLLLGDVLDKITNGYYAQVGKITKKIPPKTKGYTVGDIIFCIQNDTSINSASEGYAMATKRSVIARFKAAAKWGIFAVKGTGIGDISVRNKITVLDVSHSKLGSSRRALIVGILARKILEARIESSRKEEASEMGLKVEGKEIIPVTWLIIDEAHLLLPSAGKTAASESLIEYAKLGRKPGCGLVFATQRPSATNDEILSQVDTIIGHNLALEDDISALRRRIPAKMPHEFGTSDFIRSLPVGLALIADQKTQHRTMLVQIRPRMTHHSGKAAVPKTDEEKAAMELGLEVEPEVTDEKVDVLGPDLDLEVEPGVASGTQDIMKPTIDLSTFDSEAEEKLEKTIRAEDKVLGDELKGMADAQEEIIGTDKDEMQKDKDSKMRLESADVKPKTGLDTTPTTTLDQTNEHDISWGGAYIIVTKDSNFGLNVFGEYSKQTSAHSLSITRTHPNKLDNSLLPEDFTKIWLSKSSEKDSVSPGNITKIAHIINEFMKEKDKNVILLDGLEYLINNNDFPRILKFIEMMHEKIVLNNGVLLVPINPATLSKNNLELLENELANKIMDPSLGIPPMGKEEKKVKEVGEVSAQPKEPKVRTASKDDLKALCTKLGLKTTGSLEDLKKRLLDFEEGAPVPVAEEPETGKVTKVKAKGEVASKITDYERQILSELANERKALESLLAERKKLQDDISKLREEERKHEMELKKKKLMVEREKLKQEKRELESERRKLQKQLQESKKKQIVDIRELIDKGQKPAGKPAGKRGVKPKPELKRKPSKRDLERLIAPARKPIRKKREPIAVAEIIPEKTILTIKTRLKGSAVEEYAVKQLKTSLLGKPLEVIKNIKPVYLPILRIYIKAMRGTIFAKEHPGTFYWDTVTGEVITDVSNVLKRSKGFSMLMDLTINQAKVLAALETWGSSDVVDIQNEINMPAPDIKRALTSLKKKSLVSSELHPEKRIDNYKRMIELKFPKKFDKINVEMPYIIKSSTITDEIIQSNFKLSELEKLVKNLVPGTRIVKHEEVYYPYYELNIMGRGGPRAVLLDAVTGNQDKVLTEYLQYQK